MRFGLQTGVYTATAGVGGAGAIMVAPAQLWIGYSLLVIAFMVLIWGVTIDGKHWWKKLMISRSTSREWTPLPDVFRYLILESQWGYTQTSKDFKDAEQLIMREFFEAATQGSIQVRGLNTGDPSKSQGKAAKASEVIPKEFWVHAFLQPFGEIFQNDPKRAYAATDGLMPSNDRRSYREIIVLTCDIYRRWPRISRMKKQRNNLALAYRDWARDASGNPYLEFDLEADRITTYG